MNNKNKIIDSIVVLVVMVNTILTMLGWNPIPYSEEEIYIGISSVATVLSTIYIWLKNNYLKNKVEETEAKYVEAMDRAQKFEIEIIDLHSTISKLGEVIANGNKA